MAAERPADCCWCGRQDHLRPIHLYSARLVDVDAQLVAPAPYPTYMTALYVEDVRGHYGYLCARCRARLCRRLFTVGLVAPLLLALAAGVSACWILASGTLNRASGQPLFRLLLGGVVVLFVTAVGGVYVARDGAANLSLALRHPEEFDARQLRHLLYSQTEGLLQRHILRPWRGSLSSSLADMRQEVADRLILTPADRRRFRPTVTDHSRKTHSRGRSRP